MDGDRGRGVAGQRGGGTGHAPGPACLGGAGGYTVTNVELMVRLAKLPPNEPMLLAFGGQWGALMHVEPVLVHGEPQQVLRGVTIARPPVVPREDVSLD